jgi:hypothetical protein
LPSAAPVENRRKQQLEKLRYARTARQAQRAQGLYYPYFLPERSDTCGSARAHALSPARFSDTSRFSEAAQ